ncbi:hypothetical protein BDZ45DRAFT_243688 [Acephala macrosclerotiorum]|nr:hypothetical protein BDZ45DRAFT_243688 [Acephala macrosclerotiorum]
MHIAVAVEGIGSGSSQEMIARGNCQQQGVVNLDFAPKCGCIPICCRFWQGWPYLQCSGPAVIDPKVRSLGPLERWPDDRLAMTVRGSMVRVQGLGMTERGTAYPTPFCLVSFVVSYSNLKGRREQNVVRAIVQRLSEPYSTTCGRSWRGEAEGRAS